MHIHLTKNSNTEAMVIWILLTWIFKRSLPKLWKGWTKNNKQKEKNCYSSVISIMSAIQNPEELFFRQVS